MAAALLLLSQRDHIRFHAMYHAIIGITEIKVITATSRCLRCDNSWPATASSSFLLNKFIIPCVKQILPSDFHLPKAKAFGIPKREIPIFGFGMLDFFAKRSTMACSSGSSFSETYFTPMDQPTMDGPIKYCKSVIPTARTP